MVFYKKYLRFHFGIFVALSCLLSRHARAADTDLPPNAKKIGDLKPTFYWVALEKDDGKPKNNILLDVNGNEIARVGDRFFASLRLEGTGRMLDGRVVNFHVRMGTEIRWRICPPSVPYGYGLGEFALQPFHSVAVDPNVVPIPSKIFIPAAKGAVLPDGSVHDGYFEAVDIGDAIQNQRVDVFTSYGDQSAVFENHGLTNMKATAVYSVPAASTP